MDNISKLKKIKASASPDAGHQSLVIREPLSVTAGSTLPLVVKPRLKGVDLSNWILQHEAAFNADLYRYGGVLFRGFDTTTVEAFGKFVNAFGSEPLAYMFRSSPRHELDQGVRNVYNSTVYPKAERINLHNESSYSRTWGMRIIFCCLQPAEAGGETPIADSRKVLSAIPAPLVQQFREKGVLYRRRLIRDIGMSWQEVFQTTDRKEVEAICQRNKIQYDFISEDHLEIAWRKQAVYQHPVSGEETWFNHVFFFNKYARYEELGLSLEETAPEDLIHTDTLFGDGTPISIADYQSIREAYARHTVSFPYEKGDILFLDNMLAAHGRNAYEGNRLIATAIINPTGDAPDNQFS
ncbi:TauD/TfdA family dioxygenase [Chitinophaga flava]|uniref:Taurine catabolism dioxygenase TauD n=1 Tax=Chitinophaga flava TaxID=2259036 RepID=A0A365XZE6_9BACT|nr:TauD/TfdA family dioxygenase [Chitinophaga flava]RBL91044.1 taurine catabolism dioxygenase TauD [Chitinophaga flava]